MDPWPSDFGQVECRQGSRIIDLRSASTFQGAQLETSAGVMRLTLTFHLSEHPLIGARPTDPSRELILMFLQVDELRVIQVGDPADHLGDVDHWNFFEKGDLGEVEMTVGGLTFSFAAAEAHLQFS